MSERGRRAVEHARRAARLLREDLWTTRADPLPPHGKLRRLPHKVLTLAGIALVLGGTAELGGYLSFSVALLFGAVQGGSVVLALRRPLPAWWLCSGAAVAQAVVLPLGTAFEATQPPWPWSPAGLIAGMLVLLLVALRGRTRVGVEALTVTVLVTWGLGGILSGPRNDSTLVLGPVLLAVMVVLGSTLRQRREVREELGRQNTLTEEERARRMLLEERNRIARELHDVVAHHMSVVSIQAQVATHLVDDPGDEVKESLSSVRQNAQEALGEMRQLLGVLRAEQPGGEDPLDTPGTGNAPHAPQPTLDRLGTLVDNIRASGLAVAVEVLGVRRPLPPGVELSAYRIVQEALSNVLRHAPGSEADVRVEHAPGGLRVRVGNTRPARPAPPSPGAGQGLLGMHERAAMLGGTLAAGPLPDGGYQVSAFLPASPSGTPSTPEDETV